MDTTSMLGVSTGTETVVLLETDPATRRLVNQMLVLAGYEVREASDGMEAVRLIEEGVHTADLLLADISATSAELLQMVTGQFPLTRILLTTEQPGDGAGPEVLSKPFSPGALLSKVREVLNRPLPQRAARVAAAR